MQRMEFDSIKRCRKCILPDTLPSVYLDKEGICNHCRTYEGLVTNWNEQKTQKESELEKIIEQVKHQHNQYDCLVTLSGGKDSTFALYLAGKVYGLKCLCVTFDNGFLSDHAKRNIRTAVEMVNADHIFYTINRNTLLKLYKRALEKTGQFCSVCMRGITLCSEFPLKSHKIPMKISGDGKRISYLNAFPEVFEGGNGYHFSQMVKGDPIEEEVKAMTEQEISFWVRGKNKVRYMINNALNANQNNRTIQIQLYDYMEFSADKILNTITTEMGWTQPEGEYEHMDCLLHEMQHFVNIFKFREISSHTFYRSYLVRLGTLSRDEALSLDYEELKDPVEPEILNSFLEQIGMTRDEFFSAVKDWRKLDLFRPEKRKINKNMPEIRRKA